MKTDEHRQSQSDDPFLITKCLTWIGEFDVFKREDHLIVMSFEKPDLRYLENM